MENKRLAAMAEKLDIFVKVGGGISRAMGFVFVIFAVLVLVFGSRMFVEGSLTLDLAFVKFHLANDLQAVTGAMKLYTVVGILAASVLCFVTYYASVLLRGILAPMKESRPFEADIPGKLKKIAWVILIGGAVVQAIGVIERILLLQAFPMDRIFASEAIAKLEYVFVMDFDFVLIFFIILFISYIFSYGQALQRESDETL